MDWTTYTYLDICEDGCQARFLARECKCACVHFDRMPPAETTSHRDEGHLKQTAPSQIESHIPLSYIYIY